MLASLWENGDKQTYYLKGPFALCAPSLSYLALTSHEGKLETQACLKRQCENVTEKLLYHFILPILYSTISS